MAGTVTNKRRRCLADQIASLSATEHAEIYRMLKHPDGDSVVASAGFEYTRNNNGVFFNLTNVPRDTFEKIEKFVAFCIGNNAQLDAYDQQMKQRKLYHNVPQQHASPQSTMNAGSRPISACLDGVPEDEGFDGEWIGNLCSKVKAPDKLIRFIDKVLKHHTDTARDDDVSAASLLQKKVNPAVVFANARKKYAKKWSSSLGRDAIPTDQLRVED